MVGRAVGVLLGGGVVRDACCIFGVVLVEVGSLFIAVGEEVKLREGGVAWVVSICAVGEDDLWVPVGIAF